MSYLTVRSGKLGECVSSPETESAQHLRSLRIQVDDRIREHVPAPETPDQPLQSAMHYAVETGHRWRPLLLTSAYEAMTNEDGLDVIDVACALELIHCSTIILDDLPSVDNADLRRGRPTCHRLFGEAVTVYASHLLCALAERLACENAERLELEESPIRDHFYQLRQRLIDGQVLELGLSQGTIPADEGTLTSLYELKASLFTSGAWFASKFARQSEEFVHSICEFGKYLGMAYQLADDIADVVGDSNAMGKLTGVDIGKRNLVSHFGVQRAREILTGYRQEVRRYLDHLPFNTKNLTGVEASVLGI